MSLQVLHAGLNIFISHDSCKLTHFDFHTLITRAEERRKKRNEWLSKEMSKRVNNHTTKEHLQTRAELKEEIQDQGKKTASKLMELQDQGSETAANVAALQQQGKDVVNSLEAIEETFKFVIESVKKAPPPSYRRFEVEESGIDDTTTVPDAITLDTLLKSCDSVASPLATRTGQEEEIARLQRENEELRNLNNKRSPEKDENSRPMKKLKNRWNPLNSLIGGKK